MIHGSIWFKRLVKDVQKLSKHIEFRPVKHGFYRIYWTGGGEPAYVHEVYKWMPFKGYDMDERNPRFESHKYIEEYEDNADLVMKLKNFVEGYWDSFHTIRKRVRMFKNNKEYYKNAVQAYRNIKVK